MRPEPLPFASSAPRLVTSAAASAAVALMLGTTAACSEVDPSEPAIGPALATDVGRSVDVEQGTVEGSEQGELRVFLGIPYAAPPVGDLRFRPPAPPASFAGPFDATSFGPYCAQADRAGNMLGPPTGGVVGEEDCLTLNIWTHAHDGPRPVMVFLHGGGFVAGGSAQPLYEGASLATHGDVVLVTLNYRLGSLGFLATEGLAADSGEDSAGNYGIRDQIAALGWISRNIGAFGGDPSNVTLFGESAGGYSICALLASGAATGLFHRAIIESGGGCYGYPGLRTGTMLVPSGIAKGAEVLAEVGCDSAPDEVACLRALPLEQIVPAGQGDLSMGSGMSYWPLIDGAVVQADAYDQFESGLRELPLIIGANANEMTIFTSEATIETEEDYRAALEALIPVPMVVDMILSIYPSQSFGSPHAAYDAFLSELAFICPAQAMARASAGGAASTWAYLFDHALEGPLAPLGAFHSLELGYVFDSVQSFGATESPADADLVTAVQRAWSSFAHEGAPLTEPSWPAYTSSSPTTQRIAVDPEPLSEVVGGRCDSLRAVGLTR